MLPVDEWAATRDTLQQWLQIVGKVRLAHSPLENHWCNAPFYEFRATFVGKASPVYVLGGALDLAVARFSGRPAPAHTAGAPHCGLHVMLEAYSHEVSSAGEWPGSAAEGAFYSSASPNSTDLADAVCPSDASYDPTVGDFVLPYWAVRAAA